MAKRMLIDSTHPEETRVVVVNGTRLEEFDVETSTKRQIKGNIYLAKVVRVEPSLQAAFVEYGGNRHGFLAFGEIHPDYYQIPVADREKLIALQQAEAAEAHHEGEAEENLDTLGGEDGVEEAERRRRQRLTRQYKIQEVIKRRQIMLVQVVKEERGGKGAALTTYLSLAGRYCVLMPNSPRGGGVSRKITNMADRKRLKKIMADLEIPEGMAVIVRTAGSERSKAELKRDYEYLLRTWDSIRELTLKSTAPALIYEEANLIKRSIRDLYARDIDEVLVDGDEGYRMAKDFMRMLTPSHAKKVQPYKDPAMPLFQRFQVENQLDAMHSATAQLRSGGYIVINPTEALVSIDVNSGRATKERHIEETAYKTNLEAADEIARQLRLRDLAGLVVIDFIDMDERRNNQNVERRLKDALRNDRARIQIGRISPFGLLEMSRQRLRPSLMETSFLPCPQCMGTGHVRSVESTAMHVLRVIEEEGIKRRSAEITIAVPVEIALYILNQKRQALTDIEGRHGFKVFVTGDVTLVSPQYRIERIKPLVKGEEGLLRPVSSETHAASVSEIEPEAEEPEIEEDEEEEEERQESTAREAGGAEAESGDKRGKRRRRRRGRRPDGHAPEASAGAEEGAAESGEPSEGDEDGEGEEGPATSSEPGEDGVKRKRRRGRRGGRRRRGRENGEPGAAQEAGSEESAASAFEPETVSADAPSGAPPLPVIRDEPPVPMLRPEPVMPMVVTEASPPDTAPPEEDASAKPRRKGWWNQLIG
ncbi:MAG: Rne/Rng family ribonuclease [Alphaproteobacteria bacterium]|nr:Rne/Rng family ribonuclease [Alphaproteobacteria bacterium]